MHELVVELPSLDVESPSLLLPELVDVEPSSLLPEVVDVVELDVLAGVVELPELVDVVELVELPELVESTAHDSGELGPHASSTAASSIITTNATSASPSTTGSRPVSPHSLQRPRALRSTRGWWSQSRAPSLRRGIVSLT